MCVQFYQSLFSKTLEKGLSLENPFLLEGSYGQREFSTHLSSLLETHLVAVFLQNSPFGTRILLFTDYVI